MKTPEEVQTRETERQDSYTVYKIWNGTRKIHISSISLSEAQQYVESFDRAGVIAWHSKE